MCGISGFSLNNNHSKIKLALTAALGRAIDTRGGHGIGFVSIKDSQTYAAKTSGTWYKAPEDFVEEASEADSLLMHSRYATCGIANEVKQAHPFAVRRHNKAALYGVHNGIIWDAWASASYHKRHIDVDSQEIFELIADRKYRTLQILDGYGVAMWVEAGADYINLSRLAPQSEICVIEVENGGFVWGSTWAIVRYALNATDLTPVYAHPCKEVGRVYQISKKGVFASNLKSVKVTQPF